MYVIVVSKKSGEPHLYSLPSEIIGPFHEEEIAMQVTQLLDVASGQAVEVMPLSHQITIDLKGAFK